MVDQNSLAQNKKQATLYSKLVKQRNKKQIQRKTETKSKSTGRRYWLEKYVNTNEKKCTSAATENVIEFKDRLQQQNTSDGI